MSRFMIAALLFTSAGHAAVDPLPITPTPISAKEGSTDVKPKLVERELTVPDLPVRIPRLPDQSFTVVDHTVEVVARLQRAAKEVTRLEVWSLDPSVLPTPADEKSDSPPRFHTFRSLGREDLKDAEEIQKLLFSATLAIAQGPDETHECFEPRHGLRIHDQKGFIDVLLCYSCLQGVLYDGNDEKHFSTTNDAEADFDAIFKMLDLKKAD
jgi:hypothetical protein